MASGRGSTLHQSNQTISGSGPSTPSRLTGSCRSRLHQTSCWKLLVGRKRTVTTEDHGAVPPPVAMMGMITGYWLSQAVGVVAKLGVADHLGDGPATCDE